MRDTLPLRRHSDAGRCIATPSDRRSPNPSSPAAKAEAMGSSWRSGFDGARERIDPSTSSLCSPSSAFSSSTSSPTTLPQKVCSSPRSDSWSPCAFFSFTVRRFLVDLEVFGGRGRGASLGDVAKGTMRDPKRERIFLFLGCFWIMCGLTRFLGPLQRFRRQCGRRRSLVTGVWRRRRRWEEEGAGACQIGKWGPHSPEGT